MVEVVLEDTVKAAAGSHVGTYKAVQCRKCFSLTVNSFPSFQCWLPQLKLQVNHAQAFSFPHSRQLRDFSLSYLKKVTRGFPCLAFRMTAGRRDNCACLSNWTYGQKASRCVSCFSVSLPFGEKLKHRLSLFSKKWGRWRVKLRHCHRNCNE